MSHVRIPYQQFRDIAGAARAGLAAADKAVVDSGLEKELIELVKLRASHINGCAFCVHMHLADARKMNVAADKLDLVNVWKEANVFSARERAALAWTDALTHVSKAGGPDDAYAELARHFSESEIMFLTVAISVINSWNRIAVGLQFAPMTKPAEKAT
ncbi:carboxymuconolactone decarboxylase family protein [Terrarubrum flagellatum]|uniref:carboxymuconolactone decarboxylase family protein n=1 Tax=Terrirubrum flagellatum TaxID=2895980 RepID=UPI003144ED8B